MSTKSVRRMAATILKVGESRIWIDPTRAEDIQSAITRDDVRRLIEEGAIERRPQESPSRGRIRLRQAQRRSGRHRGHGSRKGSKTARTPSKRAWISKIRSQRAFLVELRERKLIKPSLYRSLYGRAKGGQFQSIRVLQRVAMADQDKAKGGGR